jgi:Restriction alleviation protein Lar
MKVILRECPFCGGVPFMCNSKDPLAGNGVFYLDCCSSMEEHYILSEYKPLKRDSENYAREQIIRRWNRRHE